jgi:predicted nucleic acid-binding protein
LKIEREKKMNKLLIDTMYIEEIFSSEDTPYTDFAQAIDDGKIKGISSVISLVELIKNLGMKDIDRMQTTIRELKSSAIILVDADQRISEIAGELRLRYEIPTVDSIIAATGIVEGVKHVLTRDIRHFESIKNKIKIIDIKTALKLSR